MQSNRLDITILVNHGSIGCCHRFCRIIFRIGNSQIAVDGIIAVEVDNGAPVDMNCEICGN